MSFLVCRPEGPQRAAADALGLLLAGDVPAAVALSDSFQWTDLTDLCLEEHVVHPALAGVPQRVRAFAALSWPLLDEHALRDLWHVPSSIFFEYASPLVFDLEALPLLLGHPAATARHWLDFASFLDSPTGLPARAPARADLLTALRDAVPFGPVFADLMHSRIPYGALEQVVSLLHGSPAALGVYSRLLADSCPMPDAPGFIVLGALSWRQVVEFAELAVLTVSRPASAS